MVLAVIGQIFLKRGILSSTLSPTLPSIFKTLLTPLVFFGFFLYGLSSIIWLFVLQKFPLSVAYPAASLAYIMIILLSWGIFKEPLGLNKILGCFLIIIGVYLIFQ